MVVLRPLHLQVRTVLWAGLDDGTMHVLRVSTSRYLEMVLNIDRKAKRSSKADHLRDSSDSAYAHELLGGSSPSRRRGRSQTPPRSRRGSIVVSDADKLKTAASAAEDTPVAEQLSWWPAHGSAVTAVAVVGSRVFTLSSVGELRAWAAETGLTDGYLDSLSFHMLSHTRTLAHALIALPHAGVLTGGLAPSAQVWAADALIPARGAELVRGGPCRAHRGGDVEREHDAPAQERFQELVGVLRVSGGPGVLRAAGDGDGHGICTVRGCQGNVRSERPGERQ
jgi:hypothetical protein